MWHRKKVSLEFLTAQVREDGDDDTILNRLLRKNKEFVSTSAQWL
uniref:Uncharacterized protein n=1 Tax=Arundo donax TaxID=35708 RepID=A0A0A8XV28_ARUDO